MTKKTHWQTICEFVDSHETFHGNEFKAMDVKITVLQQYRSALIKAGFIEVLKPRHYLRLKKIGTVTNYQVKLLGWEREEQLDSK